MLIVGPPHLDLTAVGPDNIIWLGIALQYQVAHARTEYPR